MHTDCVQVQRKKSRERFNPSEGDKKISQKQARQDQENATWLIIVSYHKHLPTDTLVKQKNEASPCDLEKMWQVFKWD